MTSLSKKMLEDLINESKIISEKTSRFNFTSKFDINNRTGSCTALIHGPYSISLKLEYDQPIPRIVEHTTLKLLIGRLVREDLDITGRRMIKLEDQEFKPSYDSNLKLEWYSKEHRVSNEEFVAFSLEKFLARIKEISDSDG